MTAAMVEAFKTNDNSDKTFKAKVTDLVAADKYRVLHSGKTYTTASSIVCEVGDIVRVCAPCNNYNDLYIIENKTSGRTLRDLYNELKSAQKSISELNSQLDADIKALATHKTSNDHDSRYYTESEVNNLLNGKSGTSHTHDGRYYTETEINAAFPWRYSYGDLNLNSQSASSTSIEGSQINFRGKGGNTGNTITLDGYNNCFRIFGNFNGTSLVVYEFNQNGIYKSGVKIAG